MRQGFDARSSVLGRRAFLERCGALAAGFSVSPLLVGCGKDEMVEGQQPGLPYDPSRPWWLQNDFAPVYDELDAFELPVQGAIPPELTGLYVRNGSNPQKNDSPHWFFGDGMLHGVRLEQGRAAWYRNRYVKTDLYVNQRSFGQGGAPPVRGNNQSNVSAVFHAGKLLTSGEVGFPFAINPADLSTIGVYDFGGKLDTSFTAHPKIDPKTGYLHFFGYWFVPPYLTYHVADETGRVITSMEIPVQRPTMIHSFAITEQDAVFWELPVVFDLQAAIKGSLNPFTWDPSYGARIGVLPLGGPVSALRWVEIEPCYVFHEVNAYREGDEIIVDVCRHPDMFAGDELGDKPSSIRRWHIGTAGPALTFRDEVVSDLQFELPSHDRRFTGRRHRNGWFVSTRDNPQTLELGGIGHIDFATGRASAWDPGPTRHADEAFFVPSGADDAEGDGYLFTYVYDHARDASTLAILDATRLGAGPVAEIALPRRVPHGFHAVWVPG